MTPIATEWSVYSETGVPAWAVACALAATFAVLLVWLRSECRRRPSRLAALLPWTLLLAIVPAIAILWRPVVTRVQTFRHPVRRVAVIDGTRSMNTPLAADGLARRLDLVAVWDGKPIDGRSVAARALADALARFAVSAREVAASLDRSTAEAEQGLPPGPAMEAAVAGMAAFAEEIRGTVGELVAGVQTAVAGLPDAAAVVALPEPLAAVEAAASGLTAAEKAADGLDAAATASRFADFVAAATVGTGRTVRQRGEKLGLSQRRHL